jgi:hypothetical protein
MTVAQADSTVAAMRKMVRRLTNSPNQSSLSNQDLDRAINTVYNQDFAYGVKIDQMRDVYTIYTQPFIDKYPLDVNYNQGVRAPVYFDGIQGGFYKDRAQFFNLWPRIATTLLPASGDGVTQAFSFTIPGPFLRDEVFIGSVSTSGGPITVRDDGQGNLYFLNTNPQTSVPPFNTNPAIPGMYNLNTSNPGLVNPVLVGAVNYITGAFSIDFSLVSTTPGASEPLTVKVSQYQPGRPYTLLFRNNEFTVRPVPDKIYKVEVEVYLTPIQFIETSNDPIVNQWWQYICFLAAMKIQRERNDFDSVDRLQEGAKNQENLVLSRQAVEEIGQPNFTIFNSTTPNPYLNNYWGIGWF